MRIAILALGSRGDVQPFVALGLELQKLGHSVRVAAAADYEDLISDYGLRFAPLVGNISDIMNFELVYDALDAANRLLPLGFARSFVSQIDPLVDQVFADCWQACQGAEALVVATLGIYPGLSIAEKLDLPIYPVQMYPAATTRTFADVSFLQLPRWVPLRGSYNRLTHIAAKHGLWQLLRRAINRARQRVLSLPPLSPRALWRRVSQPRPLVLHAYSQLVAPIPADWSPKHQITGYWFLDHLPDWQPTPELLHFLESGPAPVYIGFGSILAGRNPNAFTALLLEALERAGQRGVLYRGWGDLGNIPLPPSVIAVDAVPHDWLFPRMAAVVTHGGAGTTAAALRAGVPPIVVPVFSDQFFWGQRVATLGAGPPPIARKTLSAEGLAAALRQAVADSALRQNAAALGAALRAERGPQRAAQLISTALHQHSFVYTGRTRPYGSHEL